VWMSEWVVIYVRSYTQLYDIHSVFAGFRSYVNNMLYIIWNVMGCYTARSVISNWRFGKTYWFHLQGQAVFEFLRIYAT
jgi:hypothetical protein